MSTPSRIAIVGAGAMVVAILITNLVVQLAAQEFGLISFAQSIASATPEALGIGFLAGIGIYLGSRRVALDQRNGQFMKLVATAYGALGIVFSLPIKTQAVRVDMPTASDASAIQTLSVVLMPVAVAVGVVMGSLFITRSLAAFLGPRSA